MAYPTTARMTKRRIIMMAMTWLRFTMISFFSSLFLWRSGGFGRIVYMRGGTWRSPKVIGE